jgi:ferredoxin-thioredoxin reductase catalytic chain
VLNPAVRAGATRCLCPNERQERDRESPVPPTHPCPAAATLLLPALQECHCMLFLTADNDFAGTDQEISMDEVKAGIAGM